MASFVHFKFKSQREPQRISFDGPFIQVWDLKREIISAARLGDGTDFDLKIYNEGTNEEYTDDLAMIHKDSTVLARRLPAAVPGKGRAARYVSGKPPANSRIASTTSSSRAGKTINMESAQTEEERVKAMFDLNQAQWQQKQQEMAHETRVPISGGKPFQKKANVPEGEPPHGYICYRCGKKGHWIQACPTNDDATYDNKNRIKRTTGIPRSMLKKIDQSEIDNLDDSQRQNLMVNAEGDYVFAQADEKEWRKHLERVKATEAAQKNVQVGDKELQERGLECPIDKRMFVDPMKTPCCGKTYCHDCIENALLENDLTCPGCETENISLERLEPDEDLKAKIKTYEADKVSGRRKSSSPSYSPKPTDTNTPEKDASPHPSREGSKSPTDSEAPTKSRKRGADEDADNKSKSLTAPAMKRQKSAELPKEESSTDKKPDGSINNVANLPFNNMMPPDLSTMMQTMQQMNFPNMSMPMPMPMSMPGMPFMPMMNPGMVPNFMAPTFNMMNGMPGMPGMNGMNDMFANNFNNPMMNGNFNQPNMFPHQSQNLNSNPNPGPSQNQNQFQNQNNNNSNHQTRNFSNASPMNGMPGIPTGPKGQVYPPTGPANHKFSNQQRHVGKEEDNAYMRQPVNPHRHQNRGKRARQADYREL